MKYAGKALLAEHGGVVLGRARAHAAGDEGLKAARTRDNLWSGAALWPR